MYYSFIFKKILIFTLIIAGVILLLPLIKAIPRELHVYNLYNLIFYFALSTFTTYMVYLGVRNKSTQKFMLAVFGTFFFKFVASITMFLLFFIFADIQATLFLIPFGVLYFLYTTVETIYLHKVNQYIRHNYAFSEQKK